MRAWQRRQSDLHNSGHNPFRIPFANHNIILYSVRWIKLLPSISMFRLLIATGRLKSPLKPSSVGGVKVSMVAFQAVDPGSIPGWRTFLSTSCIFLFVVAFTSNCIHIKLIYTEHGAIRLSVDCIQHVLTYTQFWIICTGICLVWWWYTRVPLWISWQRDISPFSYR